MSATVQQPRGWRALLASLCILVMGSSGRLFVEVLNSESGIAVNDFVSTDCLKIYDLHGREVASLADGLHHPGQYSAVWRAENLASGVYFYRLQAGSFTDFKRLVLLR